MPFADPRLLATAEYRPAGAVPRADAAAVGQDGARAGDVALRALLVEDSAADAELVRGFLEEPRAGEPGVAVIRVDRLTRALEVLGRVRVDVVLLDLSLPDADRLEGVDAVVAAAPDVPVVVMTGLADDRVALEAVKAGAQDYLIKGHDGAREVRRAIRHAVERQELLARERAARSGAELAARARDEMAGIVSHDLRAPLTTIVACARAVLDPGADRAELSDVISRSAEWSLRIIRDLLDVAAIEAGRLVMRPEPMAPGAIVETVAALFAPSAAAAGVRLETTVAASAPAWMDADVDRLVQALGNLVANAIRFTPRGGQVAITASGDGRGTVFRVADSGCGIAPESVPHVFDRFWQARTAHRGGAGLGLAIARGIFDAHGGEITVASTVGVGTTFTCTVPAAAG